MIPYNFRLTRRFSRRSFVSHAACRLPLSAAPVGVALASLPRVVLNAVSTPLPSQPLSRDERLRAVDTAGVEPMTHPHAQTLRLRDDVADETDRREAGQAMAPAVERGLY